MSDAIHPFHLDIPQDALDDLYRRLDRARWPEKEPVDDWSQGTPRGALEELCEYWRRSYDWRRCEAELNAIGQFKTQVDGLDIHFLHARSPRPDALALLITHGWPGSVIEFLDVIARLTDPPEGALAFHVVAPSLPGFGFSDKPQETGWGVEKIARCWAQLMARLDYDRWVAQGGDWGAVVTTMIGCEAPPGCLGIHVNMPLGVPTGEDLSNPSPEEARALEALDHYRTQDSGYSKIQSTRPQTIGYGLVDSPLALAAWIYEKMWAWTDNSGSPLDALSIDRILDNIMLYWLPGTGASAARLYWESFGKLPDRQVRIPAAASLFPREILPAPRQWAERRYPNLIYWNQCEKGGHFAAWEQPGIFAAELRAAFARMV